MPRFAEMAEVLTKEAKSQWPGGGNPVTREEIDDIARKAADKVLKSQGSCVSAGMTLLREYDAFKKATPVIYRVNVKGLVSDDDLKVPHSELAMHVGAAGKDLIAFALTGTSTAAAVYDNDEGGCAFTFGREDEILSPALIETIKKQWEKRGPD